MSGREQFKLTLLLAFPSIMAQLSMCLMSYIDAAMVGRLGSAEAAAIGLVSTSTWILGSFCYANSSGFSVQIAHRCGARDFRGASGIFRQGMLTVLMVSLVLALLGISLSGPLPGWLGGSEEIRSDASAYFRIYSMFLPAYQLAILCQGSLVASGNTKIPGITSISMCVLDVGFNYLFIFKLGMGVPGAAIGTGLSMLCAGLFLLAYIFSTSRELGGRRFLTEKDEAGPRRPCDRREIYRNAFGITWPLWLQNLVSRGAYIIATVLIAPLGTIAVAANSFAIIAEGFCYLPGYGMQDAATSLVGQSLGAKKPELARGFARISIFSGAAMMGALAVIMWITAPAVMGMLSSDPEVISLGTRCLRIEAWAEILYGVSIVAYGCCVGAGDTLVPSLINLICMWAVRIGLSLLLIPRFGLEGYWIAMAAELCLKGLIFAARIRSGRWMRSGLFAKVR